jgi:inward rectifier potassium channel
MTWPRFLLLLSLSYLLINILFAAAFLACGPHALEGDHGFGEGFVGRAGQAFFFSVQTLATIGYGRITPIGWWANLLVTFESMVGIFILTLGTGLFFARFSQPSARLLFSRQAIVAPFAGGQAFELRVVNMRRSQMIEVEAKVILARFEDDGGLRKRRFYQLALERPQVTFFPLSWTLVHPIDELSPLWGWKAEQMVEAGVEFLVLLSGTDEISGAPVYARASYRAEDVVWGARFVNIFVNEGDDAKVRIDAGRLHEIELLD